MVPTQFSHIPIANIINSSNETTKECLIPEFKPQYDVFLSLVHVALKLRSDILNQTPYKGANVSRTDAESCIPDSLYMFPGHGSEGKDIES